MTPKLFRTQVPCLVAVMTGIAPAQAKAQSVLEKLPFNIKIGQTKNAEIESRGICVSRIKITDTYHRCERYEMSGGKFYVDSGQSEIVTGVTFVGVFGHELPRSWQDLGLRLRVPRSNRLGTLKADFIRIVKSAGARNLEVESRKSIDERMIEDFIFFDVAGLHFKATLDSFRNYKEEIPIEQGLSEISVTEAY